MTGIAIDLLRLCGAALLLIVAIACLRLAHHVLTAAPREIAEAHEWRRNRLKRQALVRFMTRGAHT